MFVEKEYADHQIMDHCHESVTGTWEMVRPCNARMEKSKKKKNVFERTRSVR